MCGYLFSANQSLMVFGAWVEEDGVCQLWVWKTATACLADGRVYRQVMADSSKAYPWNLEWRHIPTLPTPVLSHGVQPVSS
jgi:hypothetical protein